MTQSTEPINPAICTWCRNRYRECCLTRCAPEGKYRSLEPVALEPWEPPPPLPPFAEVLQMRGIDKLALLYIVLHYLREHETGAA